jgi:8-oxo-dGTP pyrophosphatase MutT (NUDIX family)
MGHVHDRFDFTVSMFVLHPDKPKIALHWHDKLQLWNNFGGHIELDEDPLETLHKEMQEETGLLPSEYDILETHDAPTGIGVKELPNPFAMHLWKYGELPHWHIDLPYIMKAKKSELNPLEGESQKVGWYTIEQIQSLQKNSSLDKGTLKICEWIAKKYF